MSTMNHQEIESAIALRPNADASHEDARDWYYSYGWHLSTEHAGDVTHDAVEYDWLDDSDESAVAKLRQSDSRIRHSEAEAIVERARDIRDAAESICDTLDSAATAYEARDLTACKAALLAAYDAESDHGDAPATESLADALLVESAD